ncbi:Predicted ATP-dependent carboligase, ATP-grasp superfamily [Raineyella antarctica]|uniref:Predicted ATP-dependent carboligase, ATP-grasp superfamily n=1 Tax=Raineyella antarctica TaxID=1577474 RepID=A0A1G6HI60_9ACTN|nr:PAC2 family protein [Raineyella antarctica]SDB93922.1 Predicted ATP-dependent carboligase, ATP-grasp superfamily [Raineyella antarctica]
MTPVPTEPLRTAPVAVVAFGGWGDAGDAASAVADHLMQSYPSEDLQDLDSEDYFDYQATRPQSAIVDDTGTREVIWPAISIGVAHLPQADVLVVTGPEPNLRWQTLSRLVVEALQEAGVERVVVLGSMLANTPHSRPLPVSGSPLSAEEARRLGVEVSDYEGPTGITGVVTHALVGAGIRTTALWVAVPHYVSESPQPKASLALARRLEALLDIRADWSTFVADATAWERGVDELVSADEDIAQYVAMLESEKDATEEPEASGDAIAAEFERFLRRRDDT